MVAVVDDDDDAVAILAAEATMIAVVDDVHSWIWVLRNWSHPSWDSCSCPY
jgi:hypothetical protein